MLGDRSGREKCARALAAEILAAFFTPAAPRACACVLPYATSLVFLCTQHAPALCPVPGKDGETCHARALLAAQPASRVSRLVRKAPFPSPSVSRCTELWLRLFLTSYNLS